LERQGKLNVAKREQYYREKLKQSALRWKMMTMQISQRYLEELVIMFPTVSLGYAKSIRIL